MPRDIACPRKLKRAPQLGVWSRSSCGFRWRRTSWEPTPVRPAAQCCGCSSVEPTAIPDVRDLFTSLRKAGVAADRLAIVFSPETIDALLADAKSSGTPIQQCDIVKRGTAGRARPTLRIPAKWCLRRLG